MDNREMQKELEELKQEYIRLGNSIARLEELLGVEAHQPVAESGDFQKQQYDLVKLEETIVRHLSELCMPQHINGYSYIVEAIAMAVKDPQIIHHIINELYPNIAEKFDTTWGRVERAIRHAVECCWERRNEATFQKYFGNTNKKPTNSEFFATLANLVRREMYS